MPSRDIAQENLDDLTPFARALIEWGWYENRPPITQLVKLADRIGVPRSTLNVWFSRTNPKTPSNRSWHKVREATGWPVERMLTLTDMTEPPPNTLSLGEFLLSDLEETHRFTLPGKAPIRAWLTEALDKYQRLPSERSRRRRRAKRTQAAQPMPLRQERDRERELAHSGK